MNHIKIVIENMTFHEIDRERYVIHFLNLAPTYDRAIQIAKQYIDGKAYRAKWYGGGIVFYSDNLVLTAGLIKGVSES